MKSKRAVLQSTVEYLTWPIRLFIGVLSNISWFLQNYMGLLIQVECLGRVEQDQILHPMVDAVQ